MECIMISRLSSCLVLTTVLLLSSTPCSTALPRRLLESNLAQDFVVPQAHFRARLSVQPLRWSSELASYAERLAEQRKGDCAAGGSDMQYGVNLFRRQGTNWQPSDAVAAWAEEAQNYDYGANACAAGKECGSYKQMVWRGSTKVGCSRVECDCGDTLMMCVYAPHGNVMGQKPF